MDFLRGAGLGLRAMAAGLVPVWEKSCPAVRKDSRLWQRGSVCGKYCFRGLAGGGFSPRDHSSGTSTSGIGLR